MTNRRSTKRALLTSLMALLLCFTMLLGTTYAWFTDSVTSTGNKIQAGTLKIDLELYDVEKDAYASIKESKAPIFNYDKWEPGYTDVKLLKVENEGTLALKWKATLVGVDVNSKLAGVIDVYVRPYDVVADADVATTVVFPADRNLDGYTKAGTLAEFIAGIETSTVGVLNAKEAAYLGIALKMQEEAGNEYQDLNLGTFDIQILATQLNAEPDSFDENYDMGASYYSAVSNVVTIADNATQEQVMSFENAEVAMSPAFQNALPDEVKSTQLGASKRAVDTAANTITFDELELLDQNGKVIDLETLGNTEEITVKLYVGDVFADGIEVSIYHDGALVAKEIVAGGYITYTVTHFCKVEVEEFYVKAATADELKAALTDGAEKVALTADLADLDLNITTDTLINLNGHTITDAYIKTEANVTIMNGSIKNTNEPYPLVINKGTLTVEDLAIEASKSDLAIWVRENGTLNFNSGSILATKGANNNKSKIYGIQVAAGATANINGGSITVDGGEKATAVAIFGNYQNTVNITGGRISTSGSTYSYGVWTDGNVTVSGGEIVTNENRYGYSNGITYGKNYAITGKCNVTITGGKITTYGPSGYLVNASSEDQKVSISGVDFTTVLSEIDINKGGHSPRDLVYKSKNVTISSGSFTGVNDTFLDYVEAGATVTYNGVEITK